MNVLIIDNSSMEHILMTHLIKRLAPNALIQSVYNYEDAETAFSSHTFQTIFLDLMLTPTGDNLQLATEFLKAHRNERIIVCSNCEPYRTEEKLLEAGAKMFIQKVKLNSYLLARALDLEPRVLLEEEEHDA
jgi:DNA-binding NarL/FixJ family response regulator